jgi:2-polyprenyl-3-methyl-5-hydroxy-6-metoxy-1,4-benzoquinol methylase
MLNAESSSAFRVVIHHSSFVIRHSAFVMADILESGDYARKQIFCPSRVVAWSHGSRFRLAARLAASVGRGGRLLDYGCGDGTFIALTHGTFAEAIGSDIDEAQLSECRRRLAQLSHVSFTCAAELERQTHVDAYDVVTCMEVLEHCPDMERTRVLRLLRRVVKPTGRVIVSVPIEVGPALVGKQVFRAIAAWRRQGDYRYRETYSPRELLAAALARPRLVRAEYEVDTPQGRFRYCGHKGFDWRILEREIRAEFIVEERRFTPLPALGALMNSQVWFVCRRAGS